MVFTDETGIYLGDKKGRAGLKRVLILIHWSLIVLIRSIFMEQLVLVKSGYTCIQGKPNQHVYEGILRDVLVPNAE